MVEVAGLHDHAIVLVVGLKVVAEELVKHQVELALLVVQEESASCEKGIRLSTHRPTTLILWMQANTCLRNSWNGHGQAPVHCQKFHSVLIITFCQDDSENPIL